jgi:hypothetical protein
MAMFLYEEIRQRLYAESLITGQGQYDYGLIQIAILFIIYVL